AELTALEILMAERDAEREDGRAGVVDVLVELLGPDAHLGATIRVARPQRWLRIGFVEIFENDVRLGDHLVVVDQRRHHGAAIELEVPLLLVLARAQRDVAVLPVEAFLGEAHANLLGAQRHIVVVERKHRHFLDRLLSTSEYAAGDQVPTRSGAFIFRSSARIDSATILPVFGFSDGTFSIDNENRAESASTSMVWQLRVTPGSAQISMMVRSGPMPASDSAATTLTLAGKPAAASRAVPLNTRFASLRPSTEMPFL